MKKTKKASPKAKTRRKRKQEKDLEYTDGKTHESLEAQARGLDELLSDNTSNPFKTEKPEEFERQLDDMNLAQMQEMAVRASIFPSGNKTTLKNKLSREFKSRFSPGLKIAQATRHVIDPNSEAAKRILEISKSKS